MFTHCKIAHHVLRNLVEHARFGRLRQFLQKSCGKCSFWKASSVLAKVTWQMLVLEGFIVNLCESPETTKLQAVESLNGFAVPKLASSCVAFWKRVRNFALFNSSIEAPTRLSDSWTSCVPAQVSGLCDFKSMAVWPKSLKYLALGNRFNERLPALDGFQGLELLVFGTDFNQNLAGISWPKSLRSLTFGHDFNQSLLGVTLPSTLESLFFGANFNRSLLGVTLPSRLETLFFGHHFNQSLEQVKLPKSLKNLRFSYHFDHDLQGVDLPFGLESLVLDGRFNWSLRHVRLPSTLQCLILGEDFNHSLEGVTLPNSLQNLSFVSHHEHSLRQAVELPSSITCLQFLEKKHLCGNPCRG